MVAQPGQGIGLGANAHRLVRLGIAQCDGRLSGEELDQVEVVLREVRLLATDTPDVHRANRLAVIDQRHDAERLGVRRRPWNLQCTRVVERVVGQHRLSVVERPAHQPAPEGDDVARHLGRVPFAGQHRHEDPFDVVCPVDRQVVKGDD